MDGYWLSKFAERDLVEILRYTIKTWGIEQGAAYIRLITLAKKQLVNNPILPASEARGNLAAGCRVLKVKRHFIFYRVGSGTVQIARILHQSMDSSQHVSEETFP